MNETMMDYINEQHLVCKNIINNYSENLRPFQDLITRKKPRNWLIIATGSSYNAALSAKYYIEKISGISVEIKEPFTFVHYEEINRSTDFILAISQSGKSSSTIEALKKSRTKEDTPIAILTANLDSPVTEYADFIIDIGCGVENVGYVTKGFTSTVLTLMLMGMVTASSYGDKKALLEKNEFERVIDEIPSVITATESFYRQYEKEFTEISRFSVVGYGPTVGTAKESETKFTETIRLPTQGFELEAYMHGPYLEVNDRYGLLLIQTKSPHLERIKKLGDYFSAYTDYCYSITTDCGDAEKTLSLCLDIDEYKAPLLLAIPFQIIAYRLSAARGIDLNQEIFKDFDEVLKSKV